MATSRLFVAVVPPEPVLARLEALERPAGGGRWTTRAQWHVTLHFLGQADEADAAGALAMVSARPATVMLGPRTSMLGPHVHVLAADGLDAVAGAVSAAMAGIGRPPEDRPFRGHLTLARARRGQRARVAAQDFDARFVAEEVVLLRSHTRAEGARYERVASQPLREPTRPARG